MSAVNHTKNQSIIVSFLKGGSTVLNLMGTRHFKIYTNDTLKLKSDWEKVGNDFRVAMLENIKTHE